MRRLTLYTGFALVAACASAGAPPGGPERKVPPEIVEITVDSGQTNVKQKSVEFRFDEVVSDRPAGAGTGLDQIFLISPRNGAAVVSWHRTRVDVRPKNGFRPNTAYRITMLPGLVDLRGNARKDSRTIVFSTGADFPPFSILGRVFDWAAERPVTGAYIEAISKQDTSIVYIAATDTSGQFDAGPLPAGTYLVRGLIDANANRIVDRNEKWDTSTVVVNQTSQNIELDAIERDSVPAAFDNITIVDSVTLRASFDKPLDPLLPLQPALIRVQNADSSQLEVTSVAWAAAFDKARQAAIADSIKRADTTKARTPAPAPPVPTPGSPRPPPPPPKPKAPPPERAIIIKLSPTTPVLPLHSYRVTALGMRNLVGHTRDIGRTFSVQKPPPKPVPKADTTKKAPGDTTKRTPVDTTKRAPPPARPPR